MEATNRSSLAGLLLLTLASGTVIAGGVFYSIVLPKLRLRAQAPAAPSMPATRFELAPKQKTSTLRVPPLPGTFDVRVALDPSNAHQAWAFANMGTVTDPGSIFARYGLTTYLLPTPEAAQKTAALKAMAASFAAREAGGGAEVRDAEEGVNFITVGGDESAATIDRLNRELRSVSPAFSAEIVGLSGVSTGEDAILGPADWKATPQAAAGGVIAAMPDHDGWSVLLFWCAENGIPLNLDQQYYDPHALNVVEGVGTNQVADLYVNQETVERIFLADGKDRRGWSIAKGEKGTVAISAIAARTSIDRRLASAREGMVTVASTKRYHSQTPQFIVGLKQWNAEHRDVVVRMLASVFAASQSIDKGDRDLKQKQVAAKSGDDVRWQAAEYVRDLFGAGSSDEWYDSYDGAEVKAGETSVEVGGAAVAGLQRNLLFFGRGQSGPDRGRVVYERFADLHRQYAGSAAAEPAKWDDVFNPSYVEEVMFRYPELALTDPTLPTFQLKRKGEPQELTYHVSFEQRSAMFSAGSDATLFQVLAEVILAGDARFEIHGHTDSSGGAEENLELSRRRGQAVYDWLKARLGAQFPASMEIIPHGENELAVNDFVNGKYAPDLMAKNRRVVLKIFPKKPPAA